MKNLWFFYYYYDSFPWLAMQVRKTNTIRTDGATVAPEAPPRAPREPQDGPRSPQDGPRWPQDGPKTAPDGPKMAPMGAQEWSKMAPILSLEGPQSAPRRRSPAIWVSEPPNSPQTAQKLAQNGSHIGPRGSRMTCKSSPHCSTHAASAFPHFVPTQFGERSSYLAVLPRRATLQSFCSR